MGEVAPKEDPVIAALRERIRDLEDALGLNNSNLGVVFKLPKSLSRILGLLMAVPNVTPEMMQQQLEIVTDAKVAIHRLRLHMQEFGVEVRSRRSLGYWLDDDTKNRINKMVTPEVTLISAPPAKAA